MVSVLEEAQVVDVVQDWAEGEVPATVLVSIRTCLHIALSCKTGLP